MILASLKSSMKETFVKDPRRPGFHTRGKNKGVVCRKCNVLAPLGVWAMAHANEELVSTCPKCKTRTDIPAGTFA